MNDRVWSERADPQKSCTSFSNCGQDHYPCYLHLLLFCPVRARPDHAGPDQALFCPWVRHLFWARWFGERSLEVHICSVRLVCRLLKFQLISVVQAELCKLFLLKHIWVFLRQHGGLLLDWHTNFTFSLIVLCNSSLPFWLTMLMKYFQTRVNVF